MSLPNFLIIGAQKAGTTWLHRQLVQHPDVFMPADEVHFFDKASNYERGVDWYRTFFTGAAGARAIGEKTPDYYWTGTAGAEGHLPNVHENIYRLLPEVKLILVVRNPVHRAISAANHVIRSGRVPPWYSIDDLLTGDKRSVLEPHGVIDYGRYMKHIMAFLELFDREQLKILIFEEDVVEAPARGLDEVTRFLEVDPAFSFSDTKKRRNAPPVSVPGLYLRYAAPWTHYLARALDYAVGSRDFKLRPRAETVEELYAIYTEENRRLFKFLGRDIDAWKRDRE